MSTIKSSTTTTTAYSVEADTTGALVIQTGATPTTAVTIGSDQSVTFAGAVSLSGNQTTTGNLTVNGNTTLGDANTDTILMTAAPSIGGAGLGMGMGFRNRILNGSMVIDQRNAGAAVTINTNSTIYTLDRWFAFGQATDGVFTIQQAGTGLASLPNGIKVTVTTADASIGATQSYLVGQYIEGFNFFDANWGTANAKTVTLSFWVYSSVTGTFSGSLRNSAVNRSYPFTYTISSANTWEKKSVTIAGDTTGTWVGATNGIGVAVIFSLGGGSTLSGTAGAWAGANYTNATGATNLISTLNAVFYITGVQLEVGSTATSFDYKPYGTELQLAQRYYFKNTGYLFSIHGSGTVFSSTLGDIYVKLPVSMRISPTVNVSSCVLQTGAVSYAVTAVSGANGVTPDAAFVRCTTAGVMVAGNAGILTNNNDASGFLEAVAEL